MKSMKNALVAAALLASGCATTAPAVATAPNTTGGVTSPPADGQPGVLTDSKGNKYKVVCKMERPTGSNIAEKVCRPELDDSENVQRMQDQMRNQHDVQFIKSN